ncbi:LacI family DNA-binding transcriptional regulator [Mycoplasma tauri]|uniref:LacI family DNA-binding transcriptional regulator n=1 Tax=Mycoplasma tauri TaxID=547987 RepID=UPI001CBE5DF6|nr:LacI family DNA-binding transcriptional regulator [Mycoplasma tauri]MBZ4203430.1 LacI family transcriptional regulator [Mycoplasma tauri]MBZ4226533.1 LacI family transcriptional regulator [Mycoplasma tauri]
MKNFSYKDIAKIANVSISTVSRFYNGGYVSKATKAKIREIVSKHNYYPNHGARLIRGNDNSIFVIMPENSPNYYSSVILGINNQAKLLNMRTLTIYANPDPEKYIETIRYVLSWKPLAIIFLLPHENKEKITNYIRQNVTGCGSLVYPSKDAKVNHLTIDYSKAFYELTSRFIRYIDENEKIAFVNDYKLSQAEQQERWSGFEKFCRENNINPCRIDVDNRNEREIAKFINYIYQNNIVNLVCSTHETFVTLVASKDKNLRLTDIGYTSIYDWKNNYKCKIFIDYHMLGANMVKQVSDSISNGMTIYNRRFDYIQIIERK